MELRFYATLRQVTGGKTVELDLPTPTTLRSAVDAALERHPGLRPLLMDADGELLRHVHVFLNGRDAHWLEHGLDTPITATDTIDVFPAVAGG
jgi:MoaD family protein